MSHNLASAPSPYRAVARAKAARREATWTRYDEACAIADMVLPWKKALRTITYIPDIEMWLKELGDWRAESSPRLALDWLYHNGLVDHGAPRR